MAKRLEPKTMSVPEYGKTRFGLAANGSYDAAKRGDFPTVRIGRRLYVPVEAADRKLGIVEEKLA